MKQRGLLGIKTKNAPLTEPSNQKGVNTPPKTVKPERNDSRKDEGIYSLIQQRRLQMLIHSCIYYRLSDSLITDKQFDIWARELVKLQADYPNISEKVKWYEAFKTWDGTTGFDLPLSDPWVVGTAQHLLKIHRK